MVREAVGRQGVRPLRVWLVVLAVLAGQASATELGSALARPIEAARRIAPALGVHVVELESGAEVAGHRPDELRIAASNTKLATTAAALDALGPGYFLETRLSFRGTIAGGVLDGDLLVIGGGDPNLSGRNYLGDPFGAFRPWARILREAGVKEVTGGLLLAAGLFRDGEVHPDWPRDQLHKWYEAPVAALSFSDNCLLVRVLPGSKVGAPARVEVEPELGVAGVQNRARTVGSSRRHSIRIDRKGTEVAVDGGVFVRSKGVESWVTVEDPVAYFGAAVRSTLAEEGVAIRGRSRQVDSLPFGPWRSLITHRSDLLTTLEIINKRSQNFYAESLFKLLGARHCRDGSWAGGMRAVGEFLRGLGLAEGSFELADGSGMSRGNRFTPRAFTSLLAAMFHHRWGREFMLSLPYSGESGLKWEQRLADPPYRNNVFAKTGSLNGVSALSGYARARSGALYVFSILGNETRANWRFEKAQDEILRVLIDHG